jgi:Bacterial regulatory helix-turn-helix protein, lysR family
LAAGGGLSKLAVLNKGCLVGSDRSFPHGPALSSVSPTSLRAFESAARHLSFTSAAKELGVTQGAVSHQVKGLENRLGVKLFRRTPRGLSRSNSRHGGLRDWLCAEADGCLVPGPFNSPLSGAAWVAFPNCSCAAAKALVEPDVAVVYDSRHRKRSRNRFISRSTSFSLVWKRKCPA